MARGTDDALTRWTNEHRFRAGAVFGLAAALATGVPVAITGVPLLITLVIALGAGALTGLVVGIASRREQTYDSAAMARSGTKHPYLWSLLSGLHLFAWSGGVLRLSLWVSAAVGAGTSLLLLPWLLWVIPRELERYDQGVRFLPPGPRSSKSRPF